MEETFIPKLPSYNIVQLAKVINENATIKFIGIRPGEKLHECMISDCESYKTLNCKNYFVILQNTDFERYKENYGEDFVSIREENKDYNSLENEEIGEKELKQLVLDYEKK